jgi:hypothetical protein
MVRFQLCCDPTLLAAAEQFAAESELNVSRVMRRWMRVGAAAEGVAIDG